MAYRLLIEIRATDARGEVVLHIEASLQLDAQAEPQHGSKAAGRCPALVGPERHFRIEPCGDGGAAFAREGVEIGLVGPPPRQQPVRQCAALVWRSVELEGDGWTIHCTEGARRGDGPPLTPPPSGRRW